MTHHIVIVGGGAGGFELATQLGKKLGKSGRAKITLVDRNTTHLWKPLLHEVAAGTLDASSDELNYFIHASTHYYHFQLGELIGLDRKKKEIVLAPIRNGHEEVVIPERTLHYDTLVLAFGSITNDFNIPGVREHCLFLDNRHQADLFQQLFLKNLFKLQERSKDDDLDKLHIVIVGGGATGVELAAELRYTVDQAATYGLDKITPQKEIAITLVEAAPRILSNLPERVSDLVTKELLQRGIKVLTAEKVQAVKKDELITASHTIPATLIVWCAGVKATEMAQQLDGLALNANNQILLHKTLQSISDENIFAFGDCASCPQNGTTVPPRAQAAHQEAKLLAKSLTRYIKHKPLLDYYYHDYGSLISLSDSTFGTLMGKLTGSILIEGRLARWVYLSLYKKHQIELQGWWRVMLLTLANLLTRKVKPRLKLH